MVCKMDMISILTHNVLADCHLNNFVRDIRAVEAQWPGSISQFMIKDLKQRGDLPPHVKEKILWGDRVKLFKQIPRRYFTDIQCFQEVTDPTYLPISHQYNMKFYNSFNEENADHVVTRWKKEWFEELCAPIGVHIPPDGKGKPSLVVFLKSRVNPNFRLCVVNLHHPGGTQSHTDRYIRHIQHEIDAHLQQMKIGEDRVIWCGDFNCIDTIHQLGTCTSELRRQGFEEVTNQRQLPTFFAHAYNLWGKKIDHIFYRKHGFSVGMAEVITLSTMDLRSLVAPQVSLASLPDAISDHLPVRTVLRIK